MYGYSGRYLGKQSEVLMLLGSTISTAATPLPAAQLPAAGFQRPRHPAAQCDPVTSHSLESCTHRRGSRGDRAVARSCRRRPLTADSYPGKTKPRSDTTTAARTPPCTAPPKTESTQKISNSRLPAPSTYLRALCLFDLAVPGPVSFSLAPPPSLRALLLLGHDSIHSSMDHPCLLH